MCCIRMDSPPSEREGCPKGGVVGREKVYSLFKKVDSFVFPTTSPYGDSSFQKEENPCGNNLRNFSKK